MPTVGTLQSEAGVTLTEAARLLTQIERRPANVSITPSVVRSILVLGTDARAMEPRRPGDTRLFTPVDLAVVRLNLQLRAAGVSPTVARVNVANLRILLAKHWRHGDEMLLVIAGLCGVLVPPGTDSVRGEVARVPILKAWRGLDDGVKAIRRRAPEVHGVRHTSAGEGQRHVSA
jgi:hypothetical protein